MQKQAHIMIIYYSLSDDLSLWNTISLLFEFQPERLKRCGPCWLLKLRWMGTQRVQIKHTKLVHWACHEIFVLPCLLWLAQCKIFFLPVHYFNSFVPAAQQAGAGSRAGSPVSYYMSLVLALNVHSTICTSFPMFLKEGQHVDDVSACLSIQITFKLLHAPQQGGIYVQLYILYNRGNAYIIKCACSRWKKNINARVTINKKTNCERTQELQIYENVNITDTKPKGNILKRAQAIFSVVLFGSAPLSRQIA
jgi:hypothetical protein